MLSFVSELTKPPTVIVRFYISFLSVYFFLQLFYSGHARTRNAHASFTYDIRDESHKPQLEQCSLAGYDWPGCIGFPSRSLIDDDAFGVGNLLLRL